MPFATAVAVGSARCVYFTTGGGSGRWKFGPTAQDGARTRDASAVPSVRRIDRRACLVRADIDVHQLTGVKVESLGLRKPEDQGQHAKIDPFSAPIREFNLR